MYEISEDASYAFREVRSRSILIIWVHIVVLQQLPAIMQTFVILAEALI